MSHQEQNGRSTLGLIVGALIGLATLIPQQALAAPEYAGTINAAFSSPQLSGFRLNLARNPEFADNSATAVFSIVNSGPIAELISGDNFGGAGSPSTIIFSGSSFSGIAPGQEFQLGTLTFHNGTSFITSSIFGATLTLSVPSDPSIIPISTTFNIVTTTNGGVSAFLDADFLSFPSPLSINFHVVENADATAIVTGRIVGDPELHLANIFLPPGTTNAFLTPAIPEPATYLLALAALGAFGLSRRRSKT